MKQYLLCWLLLLLFHSGYAQSQAPAAAVASDSTIKVTVMQSGRYSRSLYTINNEPITNTTLLALLKKYPESAAILRKDRAHRRWALLLTPVFLAGIIVGGVQVDNAVKNNPYEPGSNFSKAPVPFSIGLAAFAGSIAFIATGSHLGQAIEVYNKHRHTAN
ncbi:hypothetical protein HHL22_08755 [Hymenobacter sp. RP-2-7]|uniref:Uncharacterized protein n=1 Tax=Hymenobacter polaris TaxID=2682546 RepID=A0A7Y0ADC4_9BACT|nr:hypothetical protein [Hymenobacter polaris]NML65291.1 hypothetical protein [Hymenobacter polaris]